MNKMPPWNSYPPVLQSVVGENDKNASLDVDSEPGPSRDKVPSRKNIFIVLELMKGEGFSLGLFFPVEAKNNFDPWVGGRLKAEEGDAHFIFNYDDVEILLGLWSLRYLFLIKKYQFENSWIYSIFMFLNKLRILLIWITEYQSVMIFYYDRWKELQSERTIFEGEKDSQFWSIYSRAGRKEGGKRDCGNSNDLFRSGGKEDIT